MAQGIQHSGRNSATDKKDLITRAAIKVFAQRGYFSSKVADIAAEAGIADGTVYLYFKSKEEILHSIFDQSLDFFISEAHSKIKELADPIEKLRKITELHLGSLGNDRDLAIVFQVELRGSTKFMQAFTSKGFAAYLDIIRQIIEEAQKSDIFRKDIHPILIAKVLYGAIDEMVTNWILSERNYDLNEMVDVVLQIIINGAKKA